MKNRQARPYGAWLLVCAVQLVAHRAATAQPLQPAPWTLVVQVDPARLDLASEQAASILITVQDQNGPPISGAQLEILTRHGQASAIRELGNGRYESTYQAPAKHFPQVEVLVVRAPGHGLGWALLPLHGKGELEAETQPRARVRLIVAERTFGPVQADEQGLAIIPFEAPPGVRVGTMVTEAVGARSSTKPIDLGVPQVNPIFALAPAAALVADGRSSATLDIFVLDSDQKPAEKAALNLTPSAGRILALDRSAPGWYRAHYQAPAVLGSGQAEVTVALAGADGPAAARVILALQAGPPTQLKLQMRPDRLPADGHARALVEVELSDQTGNPVSEVAVSVTASAGRVTPVEARGPGRFACWLTVPDAGGPGQLEATARAVAPGAVELTASATVTLDAPASDLIPGPSAPALSPAPVDRSWWNSQRFWGWAALGVGLAGLIPGVALIGIDGQETCDTPGAVRCPEVYDSLVPGAVLVGSGAALVITGLILHWAAKPASEPRSEPSIGLAPGPSGALVVGSFRF